MLDKIWTNVGQDMNKCWTIYGQKLNQIINCSGWLGVCGKMSQQWARGGQASVDKGWVCSGRAVGELWANKNLAKLSIVLASKGLLE